MTGCIRARDNPFATWRLHEIPFRAPAFHWDEFESRWAALCYRAAIVGPHGSGKTQLIEEISQRWANQGRSVKRLRLNANQHRQNFQAFRQFISRLASNDYVLLDGAEQLNPLLWWILKGRTRACRGVLITTHHAGRLPVLLNCNVSISLLDELLRELLGSDADRWFTLAHQLFESHQGNLREVFRSLYDEFAQGPSRRFGRPPP